MICGWFYLNTWVLLFPAPTPSPGRGEALRGPLAARGEQARSSGWKEAMMNQYMGMVWNCAIYLWRWISSRQRDDCTYLFGMRYFFWTEHMIIGTACCCCCQPSLVREIGVFWEHMQWLAAFCDFLHPSALVNVWNHSTTDMLQLQNDAHHNDVIQQTVLQKCNFTTEMATPTWRRV